jgi:putative flavoprotein involved in K+ transport
MAETGDTKHIETLIIGAGQAGLATGYHLARRHRSSLLLDANDRVGDSWRARWDSLRLFTPARLSGLPGWRFPAPPWTFPTKDEMADYLEAYAGRFDLPVRTGVHVDRVSRVEGEFAVSTSSGSFQADNVVVASGAFHHPRVPDFAPDLDPEVVQIHSSEYRGPSQLREGAVLVVGAGNSGAEIALELSATHQTWLSGQHPGSEPTRPGSRIDRLATPVLWFVGSQVINVRNPIGRRLRPKLIARAAPLARVKLDDLAAAEIHRVPRTVGARDGSPSLEDGRVLEVANVIWCTGFRADFGWIDLPILDAAGQPAHDHGVVASQRGLYFVGQFFLSSLTSSLVGGVGKDARCIARHIDRQAGKRPPD